MVNIVKQLVPQSKYNIKCPYEMIPTRIVVHNTANDASARNEISYMTNNNNIIKNIKLNLLTLIFFKSHLLSSLVLSIYLRPK